MPSPAIIALSVLGAILLFLIASFVTYILAFARSKKPIDIERELGIKVDGYREALAAAKRLEDFPSEEVSVRSADGLTLRGRYFHFTDGAPLDILFHGYRSTPFHDFAAGVKLPVCPHNLLFVYQRAHGKSDGHSITFGARERYDVKAWTDYAYRRFGADVPITLRGVSMGAATLLFASELQLAPSVKCIVADCPYSSVREIIMNTMRRRRLPARLLYPLVRMGAIIYAQFDPNKYSTVDAVSRSRLPIILIHGERDSFVPCHMSDEIYAAHAGRMDLHKFAEAEHGTSYLVDTERYERVTLAFVDEFVHETKSEEINEQ